MTAGDVASCCIAGGHRPPLQRVFSCEKAFDVFIFRPTQYLVGPFKNDFSITEHEKTRIGDADEIALVMKLDLIAAIRRELRRRCDRVPNAMRHENAGYCVNVA